MRVQEARRMCPTLRCVHVETIGAADDGVPSPGKAGGGGGPVRRSEVKASLQPYRQASAEIMRVLGAGLSGGALLEKASVDEAFLDVTDMVDQELRRLEGPGGSAAGGALAEADAEAALALFGDLADAGGEDGDEEEACGGGGWGGGAAGPGAAAAGRLGVSPALLAEARRAVEASVVIGGRPRLSCGLDRRLVVGGLIALRLRRAVREALDFTCSAGVAANKLLAKVGSARNKPDKQTLVLPRGVEGLLADLPLGKLRGLGGKLGAAIEEGLGAASAGAVAALPLADLQRVLGEAQGQWVYEIVRGRCSEPVTPKSQPKSLLSCKSFEPTRHHPELQRWLAILAQELAVRAAQDEADHRRRARTLVLHYRGPGPKERSVRCAMPPHGREGPSATALAAAAWELLRRLPDALPCCRLAIAATEFDDPPAAGAAAITRFFQPAAAATHTQQQQQQPRGGQREPREAAGAGASGKGKGRGAQAAPKGMERFLRAAPPTAAPAAPAGGGAGAAAPPGRGRFPPRAEPGIGAGHGGTEEQAGSKQQEQWEPHVQVADMDAAEPHVYDYDERDLYDNDDMYDRDEDALYDDVIDEDAARVRVYDSGDEAGPSAKRQRLVGLGLDPGPEPRPSTAAEAGPGCAGAPQAPVLEHGSEGEGPPSLVPSSLADWLPGSGQPPPPSGTGPGPGPSTWAQGDAGDFTRRPPCGGSIPVKAGSDGWPGQADASPSGVSGRGAQQESGVPDDGGGEPGAGPDPDPDGPGVGLFADVDLDEQRRILHDIELARLRALGRPAGSGPGSGPKGGQCGRGGGGRRGGRGGAGAGRGRAQPGRGAADPGQTRLTALLQGAAGRGPKRS
ncbi:hypothetical protein HYH03_010719 [Edaphochlamys debaryana]|uniref:DNA polymerase eta n=1 Tax=Edaphochlamys debaryana TaxID=47281 RepID=A0A836BWB1_9CHLO|nr:hypothetical protein HYH03_010719 [Edaphochlamys debaryana]|eukprot:KAG2490797.1 hypothetical protein HYH03_010719 [Edaphochlamys debaryana]